MAEGKRIELRERLYRRRYLVPNAVTLGNMFCGFLTIIYAASGRFDKAALAIGLAVLLDGLDGRVARRLNATSRFGLEFDSFSDLISFGVAPALLLYNWCFRTGADEFGVFVTFVYAICAASRLARFNISDPNIKNFTGLPTPGAAGLVAALVNFAPTVQISIWLQALGTLVMLSLAGLMVSKIEFFSLKGVKIAGMRLIARIGLGALIALTWYNHQIGFLLLAGGYVLSGPLNWLHKRRVKETDVISNVTKLREAR